MFIRFLTVAFSIATAAALSGCGAGSPSAAPGAPVMGSGTSATTGKSWVSAEAAQQSNLLYVSNYRAGEVRIYSYDDGIGGKLLGTLHVAKPGGLCTDHTGNVYVPSYLDRTTYEYARGGTIPIRTISQSGGNPYACAVDPATGTVAITDEHRNGPFKSFATVLVYAEGRRPKQYKNFAQTFFAAYDNRSNLFVDASICKNSRCDDGKPPQLYELSKGAFAFVQLKLQGATLAHPTGMQWVNPTLLVTDNGSSSGTSQAYKVFVRGRKATVVATLPLANTARAFGTFVRAGFVIVPDELGDIVRIYHLSDGTLYSSFTNGISKPFAAVVSQK
jgi:hypothetical protein